MSHAVLVEEPLLFSRYAFCRQELMFHRATLRWLAGQLRQRGHQARQGAVTAHHSATNSNAGAWSLELGNVTPANGSPISLRIAAAS